MALQSPERERSLTLGAPGEHLQELAVTASPRRSLAFWWSAFALSSAPLARQASPRTVYAASFFGSRRIACVQSAMARSYSPLKPHVLPRPAKDLVSVASSGMLPV